MTESFQGGSKEAVFSTQKNWGRQAFPEMTTHRDGLVGGKFKYLTA